MADRHPLIIGVTALLILALSYAIIGRVTDPWRGVAAGVVLAAAGGALIWFAKSRRHAMARAVFAVATTLITAPIGAISAVQNDFLYDFIGDLEDFNEDVFDTYEAGMAFALPMLGIGTALGLVLFFVGWRLHRTPIE